MLCSDVRRGDAASVDGAALAICERKDGAPAMDPTVAAAAAAVPAVGQYALLSTATDRSSVSADVLPASHCAGAECCAAEQEKAFDGVGAREPALERRT